MDFVKNAEGTAIRDLAVSMPSDVPSVSRGSRPKKAYRGVLAGQESC